MRRNGASDLALPRQWRRAAVAQGIGVGPNRYNGVGRGEVSGNAWAEAIGWSFRGGRGRSYRKVWSQELSMRWIFSSLARVPCECVRNVCTQVHQHWIFAIERDYARCYTHAVCVHVLNVSTGSSWMTNSSSEVDQRTPQSVALWHTFSA